MTMEDWRKAKLRDSLVEGLSPDNAEKRIRLLVGELADCSGDMLLRMLTYQRAGSIEEEATPEIEGPFATPLKALIKALERALELGIAIDELLAWVSDAPLPVVERLRMWLLTTSHDAHTDRIVEEITNAIPERAPTGDDLLAVERLTDVQEIGDDVLALWLQVVPEPPSAKEVGHALSEEEVPEAWIRMWQWSGVLPPSVTESWADVNAILDSRYGPMNSDRLRGPRQKIESYVVGSPISAEELQSLPIDAAAARIAEWERDPFEFRVGYRELARTLEEVVSLDPSTWATEPIKTIARLKEPIYVSHFLNGLAKGSKLIPQEGAPKLVAAIEFVFTSPWDPKPMGRDDTWDYDPDWNSAMDSGVELIGAMASHDLDLGNQFDPAWELVNLAIRHTERTSGLGDPDEDPYALAINRPCCQALIALLQMVGSSFRIRGEVPHGSLDTLDWVLQQPGEDGRQFRSVLASRIGFLRHVVPEWIETRAEDMFGDGINAELGTSALHSAVHWAQPNQWLLRRFPGAIQRLALEGDERAIDMTMLAMLWEVDGYELNQLVQMFLEKPHSLSVSGGRLAFLLRPDDVDELLVDRAVEYWTVALESDGPSERLAGFGWFSEVSNLSDHTLLEHLLVTVRATEGRIEWAEGTARRVCCPPVDPRTFEILRWLFRAATEPWVEQDIASSCVNALQQAEDDMHNSPEYQSLRESLLAKGYFAAAD